MPAMSKGPNKRHYHAQRQHHGPAGTSAHRLGPPAHLYRDAWEEVKRAARGDPEGWYRVVECTAWHV